MWRVIQERSARQQSSSPGCPPQSSSSPTRTAFNLSKGAPLLTLHAMTQRLPHPTLMILEYTACGGGPMRRVHSYGDTTMGYNAKVTSATSTI